MPCCSSRAPRSSVAADPDEVARHRRRVEAGRDESFADALALGELRREVVAGIAERCSCDPRGGSGDRRRRPARIEHCGGRRSCDRVPDPERGVAEGLRHRSQHDQVRALAEPGHDGLAAVLDVGLVDDHRSVGMAPRELDELGRRGDSTSWVVGVTAPDQARAVSAVRSQDRIGAGEHRGDAVERVGRRDDRGRPSRGEVGTRTEQDEIVRSRADHDLVPCHLGAALARDVRCRRFAKIAVGPVGIRIEGCKALGERDLGDARECRRVLVELQHLGRSEAMPCGDLRHGGRPRVGGEAVWELDRGRPSAHSGRYDGCSRAVSNRPVFRHATVR